MKLPEMQLLLQKFNNFKWC